MCVSVYRYTQTDPGKVKIEWQVKTEECYYEGMQATGYYRACILGGSLINSQK